MLGCGAVAREFFLPALQRLNKLKNLTVLDIEVPNDLRQIYPEVEFIQGDFRALSRTDFQQDVTASIVCLPNSLHEEAVLRLLDAGAHVLCEKPLALSEGDCLRMSRAAASARRLLAVNMIRRTFPSVRLIHQLARNGRLGKIIRLEVEHGGAFHWPAQSLAPFARENGGVLADMGIHYLDWAQSVAGILELRSYEDDSCGGVEAEAKIELTSACGAEVKIHVSRLRSLKNTIKVVGSDASIAMNVDSISKVTMKSLPDGEEVEIRPLGSPGNGTQASFLDCFVSQLQRFEKRLLAGDISTEESEVAARSARVIQQAYEQRVVEAKQNCQSRIDLPAGSALVTGATGFIGSRLVERLVGIGTEVTASVRRAQTCASIARFPIKLVNTSLLDFDSVRRSVQGKRYVFHLAYGRDGADAQAVTVAGTKNVVNAAIEAQCEAVVILSTINVLGWPEGEIDETAPYRPAGGAYGRTKATMERWCLQRAETAGATRIVVLLPSCVYGPGGATFTELPAKLASSNGFAWIAGGQGLVNYVFVDNLIDAILQAASSIAAHGQRFIVNDGWTCWRDFLSPIVGPWASHIRDVELGGLAVEHARRRRGALKRAIRAVVSNSDFRREFKQTKLGSFVSRLVRSSTVLAPGQRGMQISPIVPPPEPPPIWLEELFGPHLTRFSSAKAQSVLGWRPQIRLDEGHRASVKYLLEMGLHPAAAKSGCAAIEPSPVAHMVHDD